MRKTKRLQLGLFDLSTHYFITFWLLFIPIVFLFFKLRQYYHNDFPSNGRSDMGLIIGFTLLGIVTFLKKRRELRFKELSIHQTYEQFKEAIARTSTELDWRIENCNEHYTRAYTFPKWSASTGEMITIIRNDNTILINSVVNFEQTKPSAFSFGANSKNIRIFIAHLNNVVKNIEEARIDDPDKGLRKWSFANTALRLGALSLWLLIFTVFLTILFDGKSTLDFVLMAVALSCVFIIVKYLFKTARTK